MLPIIFQHVRELAEVNVPAAERDRYKIITPFPPGDPDYADFAVEDLAFNDQPADAVEASKDTLLAYQFFNRTDCLYYDYSYGIKSEDKRLSADICQRFFREAQTSTAGIGFSQSFAERSDAFLNRYKRQTAGTLGDHEFRYSAPAPISWNAEPVVLNPSQIERLKEKAVGVYEDLQSEAGGMVNDLINEIKTSNYSLLSFEFGSFDVIREWMDPRLFDSPDWKFSSGDRTLYGESDAFFTENEVNLCYAQRFYVVRNLKATPAAPTQVAGTDVRDHRQTPRPNIGASGGVAVGRDHRHSPGIHAAGSGTDGARRRLRNGLIQRKIFGIQRALAPAAPAQATLLPRTGFSWSPATPTVPGHWERARSGAPPPSPPADLKPADKPSYKIAAIKCRILFRKP